MTDKEIVAFLSQNGYINLDIIQAQIEMAKRKKLLEGHQYKIWQNEKTGYWYTELPAINGGKRKLVKKRRREDLDDAIVEFYSELERPPSLEECFKEWVNKKIEYNEIGNGTYDRYCNDYKRFFDGEEIADTPIKDITADILEDFIKDKILENSLTSKAYGNMRTLIIGTFKLAKKNGYTDISISSFFGDLELSKKSFTKPKKKPQVFKDEEAEKITEWLREHPTIENLGVLLAFQTGIREGELAALKFSDIEGEWLHVQRQEIRYKSKEKGKCVHEIVEYTKTEAGDRRIVLTDSAKQTIAEIRKQSSGEFMMVSGSRNISASLFNRRIYLACDALGIPRRSMHKIRKTYGTTLIDAGVEDSIVCTQMGHTDIATTRKYYYHSKQNDEQYINAVRQAVMV